MQRSCGSIVLWAPKFGFISFREGVGGGLLEGENLKNFLVFALLVCHYYAIVIVEEGTVLISIVLAPSHPSIAQYRISCDEAVNCSMNV